MCFERSKSVHSMKIYLWKTEILLKIFLKELKMKTSEKKSEYHRRKMLSVLPIWNISTNSVKKGRESDVVPTPKWNGGHLEDYCVHKFQREDITHLRKNMEKWGTIYLNRLKVFRYFFSLDTFLNTFRGGIRRILRVFCSSVWETLFRIHSFLFKDISLKMWWI